MATHYLRCVCSAAREALGRPWGEERGGGILSPRAQLGAQLVIEWNYSKTSNHSQNEAGAASHLGLIRLTRQFASLLSFRKYTRFALRQTANTWNKMLSWMTFFIASHFRFTFPVKYDNAVCRRIETSMVLIQLQLHKFTGTVYLVKNLITFNIW